MKLFIFMSKFSMETCLQIKLNWLSKERKDTFFHIMSQKDQKPRRKLTIEIPKFKFPNRKLPFFWLFWDKQVCGSQTPPENVEIFLQILNPVNDAEVLAPESGWEWLTTTADTQKLLNKKNLCLTRYRGNSSGLLVPALWNVCQLIADTMA